MTVHLQIQAARRRQRLTQGVLGRKVGVTKQAVSHWESGRYFPAEEHLDRLCAVLNLDYEQMRKQ